VFTADSDVPPIRPTLIGDAFVRSVIAECNSKRVGHKVSEKESIVAAAWMANPSGMLASALRLAVEESELGRLARLDPVADLGLSSNVGFDAAMLAQAYALAAMSIARGDWESGQVALPTTLIQTAEERIARLPPKDAAAGLENFIGSIPLRNDLWIVRGAIADSLIGAWLNRALEFFPLGAKSDALDRVIRVDRKWWGMKEQWGTSGEGGSGRPQSTNVLRAAYDRALSIGGTLKDDGSLRSEISDWVEFFSHNAYRSPTHASLTLDGLAGTAQRAGYAPLASLLSAFGYSRSLDSKACREAVLALDRLAEPFPEDREFRLLRVRAWQCLAYALRSDAGTCRDAVDKVDRLSAPFAGDREFELGRTRAWRHLALSLGIDAVACRDAVDTVDRLAAPFAGDREFEYQRAEAWAGLAFALRSDAVACRDAADMVDRLCAPFAGEGRR